MKKYIPILLIAVIFNLLAKVAANPVTQNNASAIAVSWYTHIARSSVDDPSISDSFAISHDELVTMYVFNFISGGFVIVAADDASIPILGYSEKNSFPAGMSCPAVKQWMENYSIQIDQIIQCGLSNRETIPEWEAIRQGDYPPVIRNVDPLLTTTWKQGCFYNELCPADPSGPCGHTVTGCVATAMAQVMKYHNFPPQGVGSHSYMHHHYGELSADFGNTIYDWASMPDNVIYANISVATLMYHAGNALDMYYGPNASGANPVLYEKVLINYFNYRPGIEMHYQPNYPDPEEWKKLLRDDLDNHLPVLYCGFPPKGVGHAFVCDGYVLIPETKVDKFHFNWGWGGDCDGYYEIGKLNPGNYDYNFNDWIWTGIRPNHPELITRIQHPVDNSIFNTGQSVEIEAVTVYGIAEQMKITIDDMTVATGTSNTLSYTWAIKDEDLGSHEVRSWSFSGNDSVYYPVIMNVNDDWIKQSSGFQTPYRINYISAVDSNVVWAIARDWTDNPPVPCQAYTMTMDGGKTWIAGNIPDCEDLTFSMIQGVTAQKAYAALYRQSGNGPQGIYITTDGGNTWEHQSSASFSNKSSWVSGVHFFNENDGWCMGDPIADGSGYEMYTTSNGGANWVPVPADNMPPSIFSEESWYGCFSAINDTLWFGTSCGRIFKSTDKGYTWTVTLVNETIAEYLIPVFRNSLHGLVFNALGHPKLYETFDGGESWDAVDYTGPLYQTDLAFISGTANTWVSTGGLGVFDQWGASYSLDGGHTWTAFHGTEGIDFRNMAWINPHCGWAGGFNSSPTEGGMFKFTGDFSVPFAIGETEAGKLPFSVYPNPFSFNTTIEFSVPETGMVTLSVYDISGRLLDRILSGKLARGEQRIEWDGGSLKSGAYFLRLELDATTQVSKIIILNNP